MKKIIPLALIVFIVTAFAAYSGLWFVQSRAIKENITAWVASVNSKSNQLSFASVETSGFPMTMKVHFKNPKFVGHIDPLLSKLAQQNAALQGESAGVLAPPTFAAWAENMSIDGEIIATINMLSNTITLESIGTWSNTSTIGDSTISLTSEYDSSSHCSFKQASAPAAFFAQLWNFNNINLSPAALKENLRNVTCDFSPFIITNQVNSQLVATGGATHLSVDLSPSETRRKMTLKLSAKELEVLPEGDNIYNAYVQATTPIGAWNMPARPSMQGKQTFDIGLTFDAPKDEGKWKSEPVFIQLKPFNFSANSYQTTGDFTFDLKPTNDNFALDVELNFNTLIQETYRRISEQFFADLVDAAYADKIPEVNRFISNIQSIPKETLKTNFWDALPNISTMGSLTQKISANASGNFSEKNGKLDLKTLELSARDYGIAAQGNITSNKESPQPKSDFTLQCRNCAALIDTLYGYAVRVQSASNALQPDKLAAPMPVSAQNIDMLKQGLDKIAPPTTDNNGTLHVLKIRSENGLFTLNDKPLAEAMMMLDPPTAAPATP